MAIREKLMWTDIDVPSVDPESYLRGLLLSIGRPIYSLSLEPVGPATHVSVYSLHPDWSSKYGEVDSLDAEAHPSN